MPIAAHAMIQIRAKVHPNEKSSITHVTYFNHSLISDPDCNPNPYWIPNPNGNQLFLSVSPIQL